MANHTPEPWKYTERMIFGDAHAAIVGSDGSVIASTEDYYPVTEENQRRIVACVNACVGVSDDALDGGWEAAGLSAYAKRLEVDLAAVTAQRDELRLRLSSMVGVMRNLCESCGWSALDFPDIEKAEALIDKCEVQNDA